MLNCYRAEWSPDPAKGGFLPGNETRLQSPISRFGITHVVSRLTKEIIYTFKIPRGPSEGNASYSGDRGREQEREQERQTDDDDDDDDEVWEILLDETKSVDRKSAPIKPSENRYKTMLTSSFWNRG
ncbi:hypothetical protein TWF569_008630 [Orbilia oligospora]|nr:hypothetical protein TWF103_011549 [Orbilia oligospora]KAF3138935.1 hypothetical protein TWF569_008630 [Orbilia oligospora]